MKLKKEQRVLKRRIDDPEEKLGELNNLAIKEEQKCIYIWLSETQLVSKIFQKLKINVDEGEYTVHNPYLAKKHEKQLW